MQKDEFLLSRKEVSIIALETAMKASSISSLKPERATPIFIDEVCDLTGYSRATIYSLVHKREIPFHKSAGRRRLYFLKSEILSWMSKKGGV